MANDVEIMVVDQQNAIDTNRVDYLPFGTKVLKLRVRRNQHTKPELGPIWLRPKGYVRPDSQSLDPQRWRAYGSADDDPELWVAWGAGDERGFCARTQDQFIFNKVGAPLDDDAPHYVYLHLIHRPSDPITHQPSDKTLTVCAVDMHGQVYAEKQIVLEVPDGMSNPLRLQWEGHLGVDRSTLRLHAPGGTPAQIPQYVSRWWPANKVEYVSVDETTAQFLSGIRIYFDRQGQDINNGTLDVFAGGSLLAHFSGYLSPLLHDARLVGVEVFRFSDDRHWVLRLWFYWLHVKISEDLLLAYVPSSVQADWREEAKRVCQQLDASLSYHKREEIPDIERFDLVIDPLNPQAQKFVGTDTHWQEFWGYIKKNEALKDQPLDAGITSPQEIFELLKVAKSVPKKQKPVFDPLSNGLCDMVNHWDQPGMEYQCPYRGQGVVVNATEIGEGRQTSSTCPRCGTHFSPRGTREAGLWDKHAPWVRNVVVNTLYVSTSVLEG